MHATRQQYVIIQRVYNVKLTSYFDFKCLQGNSFHWPYISIMTYADRSYQFLYLLCPNNGMKCHEPHHEIHYRDNAQKFE